MLHRAHQEAARRVRDDHRGQRGEFPDYRDIESATGVESCFATPCRSWERGTNENTNGLIRQYLPKGRSMAHITQAGLDAIAARLNSRPRKRLGYKTPEECYAQS